MIKECKVLNWNELIMVIDFDGELIQMPSTKAKVNLVYIKLESGKYKLNNEDEYKKSLVKYEKKENKRDKNDDK